MPPQQTQAVMLASIMGKACQFDIRCIAKASLPKGDVYLSGWIEKPGLSEKRGSSFFKARPSFSMAGNQGVMLPEPVTFLLTMLGLPA
jgi:hypothetical protein